MRLVCGSISGEAGRNMALMYKLKDRKKVFAILPSNHHTTKPMSVASRTPSAPMGVDSYNKFSLNMITDILMFRNYILQHLLCSRYFISVARYPSLVRLRVP